MYIGISNSQNEYGKKLKFGGTCIINNDQISIAVSEERLTRNKYCGGYELSLKYCLDWLGATKYDIKGISTSSCCDYKADIKHFNSDFINLQENNHHFSHALSSFFCSPYDEAIVVVMDGGGNTLTETTSCNWWEHSREQVSIYHAKGYEVTLIGHKFDKPFDTGYGEAFRSVTKFLGFGTTENAGKVMALSGMFNGNNNKNVSFFDPQNRFINNPLDPIDPLNKFIKSNGLSVKPRLENEEIKEEHYLLANILQSSFQNDLVNLLDYYIELKGISNICLAGGVALNCTANTFVLESSKAQGLYIHPASNDSGQCIGNAIYSYIKDKPKDIRFDMNNSYLGKDYEISKNDILKECNNQSFRLLEYSKEEASKEVAKLLSNNVVVGFYNGRSEFGPRALGNRSVLGNPSSLKVKEFINTRVKCRESFMPLAASIMQNCVADYFEGDVSKFMLLAPSVKYKMRPKVSAIVHNDGSCRAQSVDIKDNPYFYNLIHDFYKITGIPMLINTSMNGRGDPIVETLEDAFNWFNSSPLKCLVINGFLVAKE